MAFAVRIVAAVAVIVMVIIAAAALGITLRDIDADDVRPHQLEPGDSLARVLLLDVAHGNVEDDAVAQFGDRLRIRTDEHGRRIEEDIVVLPAQRLDEGAEAAVFDDGDGVEHLRARGDEIDAAFGMADDLLLALGTVQIFDDAALPFDAEHAVHDRLAQIEVDDERLLAVVRRTGGKIGKRRALELALPRRGDHDDLVGVFEVGIADVGQEVVVRFKIAHGGLHQPRCDVDALTEAALLALVVHKGADDAVAQKVLHFLPRAEFIGGKFFDKDYDAADHEATQQRDRRIERLVGRGVGAELSIRDPGDCVAQDERQIVRRGIGVLDEGVDHIVRHIHGKLTVRMLRRDRDDKAVVARRDGDAVFQVIHRADDGVLLDDHAVDLVALDEPDDGPDELLRIGKIELVRRLIVLAVVADDDGEGRRRRILLLRDGKGVNEPRRQDDRRDHDEKDDVLPERRKQFAEADRRFPFLRFILHYGVFFHCFPHTYLA